MIMGIELNKMQSDLFDFVKLKHGSQVRKYTNEPYYNHLLRVASIVSDFEVDCIEIALCHDLFEDTNCTFNELYKELVRIGYKIASAYHICVCVNELTDKYTKEEYPYLNRAKRKKNECERLSKISYKSQSVKYADLIDNTSSIVEHNRGFAKVYLEEKSNILSIMNNGNCELYDVCVKTLNKSKTTLEDEPK